LLTHHSEKKNKRLAQTFVALTSKNSSARSALRFLDRADELTPENVDTVADFLHWVSRVTQKAHLIGYDGRAMSLEAVYRLVAMNALVSECLGEDYEEHILRSTDLDELSCVLRGGLADAVERVDPTTRLSIETRRICEAYVEQVHALGILP
jgi:hypothetical protein